MDINKLELTSEDSSIQIPPSVDSNNPSEEVKITDPEIIKFVKAFQYDGLEQLASKVTILDHELSNVSNCPDNLKIEFKLKSPLVGLKSLTIVIK